MKAFEVVFGLLIAAAIVNVIVKGPNSVQLVNAGGTQLNNIFGTLTKTS